MMLGNIVFFVLILVEIGFVVWSIRKKTNLNKEKAVVRIGLFTIFFLLVLSPIIQWGFQWTMLGVLLGLQALWGGFFLFRKKQNQSTRIIKVIWGFLGRVLLISMVLIPIILFPQYEQIKTTGEHSIATKSFTITDQSRKENFTEEANDNRNVTIQFWYPQDAKGKEKFPLVIFSHGAFGLRTSNYSTYQELASNGYVVVSIDHTYHAFMTKEEDGKTIITNMDFMNDAMKATNGDIGAEKIYELEQEWMKLRTGDMAFVLDYIKEKCGGQPKGDVYQLIDLEHIGVFGHSLGGATAAQLGREDDSVDAVIVIDGTMLGEITGFQAGKYVVNDTPYPKPIMNLYSEVHYEEVVSDPEYVNGVVQKNAEDTYQVVMKDSDHMNFTDLPLVSPILSSLLGTGDVDARECIETNNEVILQFFDRYLKSSKIDIPKTREF